MVNKDIVTDGYLFYRIDDQLEGIGGSSYFKTIDLTKGYHQMNLDKSSKEITAFTTPCGLF